MLARRYLKLFWIKVLGFRYIEGCRDTVKYCPGRRPEVQAFNVILSRNIVTLHLVEDYTRFFYKHNV